MKNRININLLIGAGIGLTILAIIIAIPYAVRSTAEVPVDLASQLSGRLVGAFQKAFSFTPKILINETVVQEQSIGIAELALIRKEEMVEYQWSHTWMGSTKKIYLRAKYTAKAGFDLREEFQLHIDRASMNVTASMPEAKLLSLEMDKLSFQHDENGLWNKVSKEDREGAMAALRRIAREKALGSGILTEVKNAADDEISRIIRDSRLLASGD